MFYRRKIILSLLDQFGGSLMRTDFQKLLFLFSEENEDKYFDFVPYKFGCFSFQAQQDVSTMIKYGQINESDKGWVKKDPVKYSKELKMKDRIAIARFFNRYKDLKNDDLIKYVYTKYPYYAINSEIKNRVLNAQQSETVDRERPVNNAKALYTIGYEGRTVEKYANLLLQYDIKILCDVRKNSKSMKYGFSKNQLKNVMDNIGIQYIHLPGLGIVADKRKNLNSFADYSALFEEYKKVVLPDQSEAVNSIADLIETNQRVALTCFEADHNYCHRSRVADEVIRNQKGSYDLIHI